MAGSAVADQAAAYLPPSAPGTADRSRSPESSFRAWSGWPQAWTRTESALETWAALGFGFVELGTVTAQPQPGNDKPRLFRLPESRAIINRMGFNNRGAQALAHRLAGAGVARGNMAVGIPLGISIGKTKSVPLADATEDYLTSLRTLAPYADYLAINVSSPNTPGLRSLQDSQPLADLITTLVTEAWRLAAGAPPIPIFVKVAPDLTEPALEDVVQVCSDAGAEGLIATNTTLVPGRPRRRRATRNGVRRSIRRPTHQTGSGDRPLPRPAHQAADHRRRRHHEPRRRRGDVGRRRQPAADLHRLHLRRPSTGQRSKPVRTGSCAAVLRRSEGTRARPRATTK